MPIETTAQPDEAVFEEWETALTDDAQSYGKHALDETSTTQWTMADFERRNGPDTVAIPMDHRLPEVASMDTAVLDLHRHQDEVTMSSVLVAPEWDTGLAQVPLADQIEPGRFVQLPIPEDLLPDLDWNESDEYHHEIDKLFFSLDACRDNMRYQPDDAMRVFNAELVLAEQLDNEADLNVLASLDGRDLRHLMGSLDRLEEACGGRESLSLDILMQVPAFELEQAYNAKDPALNNLLVRSVEEGAWRENDEVYGKLLGLTHSAFRGKHGDFMDWKANGDGVQGIPEAFRPLLEKPGFTVAMLDQQLGNVMTDPDYDLMTLEDRVLTGHLGLSTELTEDFSRALAYKTVNAEQQDNHTMHEGRDLSEWLNHMSKFVNNVEALGPDGAQKLYDTFGLVNFDRYEPATLERMHKLAQGDAETIAAIQRGDSSVVISDTFGDQNGAMGQNARALDDGHSTIMFEARQPSDLYRSLITLNNRFGITPSTVSLNVHGQEGFMAFGTGTDGFLLSAELGKDRLPDFDGRVVPIAQSSIGRFMNKYMQPSHATGERTVILASCLQAATNEGQGITTSTAEVIAQQAADSDLVRVRAAEKEIAMVREEDGVQFKEVQDHKAVATEEKAVSFCTETKAEWLEPYYVAPVRTAVITVNASDSPVSA